MSDKKLDFRKMKQTQFDPGQVMKGSFSELQSGLRTFTTTPILKDAYTHFIQELDSSLRPTKVEYYQAIDPARDRLTFRSDNAGDLAGKYFSLQEPITKKVHVFWYRVSSVGTAPGIGDIEHVIDINENDASSVVSFATRSVIKTISEFNIIGNNLIASYIDIEYYQFGEAQAIDLGTSGFSTSRTKQGESIFVGAVEISYDSSGNPVYNNNTLKGFTFNQYNATFEVSSSAVSIAEGPGLTSTEVYGKQALDVNIVDQVVWDAIEITFPNDSSELFTYRNQGTPVQTVLVGYVDAAKRVIISVNKTRL
jgi:hypothetical protein